MPDIDHMNAHLHPDTGVICYQDHDVQKLVAAGNLLQLIIEHREHCPGESCTVSLMSLLPIYTDLVGHSVSPEEMEAFL